MIRRLLLNDRFILWLILLNALIIFVGGYINLETHKRVLIVLDNGITIIFVLEIFFKWTDHGFRQYFKSNWNKLDFILVLISAPSLVTYVLDIQIADFSFLLVFRTIRVLKIVRFFKFIPNITELVSGVRRALKASVFVLLGFAIYIFLVGVVSFHLFHSTGSEYFQSPLSSLYSTFRIFTIEGWVEIPEQIVDGYSKAAAFFTYIYFIFVVLSGGVFGLSIVNSIFVDAMVSDNYDELEKKLDVLESKIDELLIKINRNET
jgi:voltage-gated sodium channel